jgi:hypothetical protein
MDLRTRDKKSVFLQAQPADLCLNGSSEVVWNYMVSTLWKVEAIKALSNILTSQHPTVPRKEFDLSGKVSLLLTECVHLCSSLSTSQLYNWKVKVSSIWMINLYSWRKKDTSALRNASVFMKWKSWQYYRYMFMMQWRPVLC